MRCIPKHLVNEFLSRLKSGEITPEKLMEMDSAQRNGYFASFLGAETAQFLNASFESKMLLKGQQEGIINWAKQASGMKQSAYKDILTRVNKMDSVLTPQNQDAFLEDLVAHKLGISVTMQEAANLASLAKDALKLKENIKAEVLKPDYLRNETPVQYANRIEYGYAHGEFIDYYTGLKHESDRVALREYIKPANWGRLISKTGGYAKALKASFDNSVIGRQGFVTAMTHPEIWAKNSARSFGDFWNSMTGKDAMKEVRADIISRPNSINHLYQKEKLAVGVVEEAYPTSAPEKIPYLGKVFKGSQDAFTAWQYRTRADTFDLLVDVANKSGADIKGLGMVVNSMTGRGNLGNWEPNATAFNNIFFSPRYVKANIDVLTAHALDKGIGGFARKQAAMNLVKVIVGSGIILGIAKALDPDSVEEDPRSSDFGKIRIGNTRFTVTGGLAGLVILTSRVFSLSTKSSTTGLVTPLNSGEYGAKTIKDIIFDFLEGKLSPVMAVIRDLAEGKDFQGRRPTVLGEMNNLFTPLPISNAIEVFSDPDSANVLLALIADGLGVGTNTYGAAVDWSSNIGLELRQFHERIGEEKFKEANKLFNERYREMLKKAQSDERYNALSDEDKADVLQKERTQIKEKIFKEYRFRYRPEKKRLPDIR